MAGRQVVRYDLGKVIGRYCITAEDGQTLYDELYPLLQNNVAIEIDFSGVKIGALPFLNAAFGQLFRDLNAEEVKFR